MKKILIPVLLTIFASCSKSDDSTPSQIVDTNVSNAQYFNFTYDGQVKNVTSIQAVRQEDFIEVMGRDVQNGISVDFKFNKYGNLYAASTSPASSNSTVPNLESFYYFNANTIDFKLIDLNPTDKTVTVSYSGKVFDNFVDHTSLSKVISGSFKVKYIETTPSVSGIGTSAKLNGIDWYGKSKSSSTNNTETELYTNNGSQYSIKIIYASYKPVVGISNFVNNKSAVRFGISKYDPVTHTDIDYIVTGTINYTTAFQQFGTTLVAGTFSGVAKNPIDNSTITITNGTFKEFGA